MDRLAAFGRLGMNVIASLGRSGRFLVGALAGVPRPSVGFPLLLKQLYSVGVLSLAIIVVVAQCVFRAGWLASDNLWDYLMDPWLVC